MTGETDTVAMADGGRSAGAVPRGPSLKAEQLAAMRRMVEGIVGPGELADRVMSEGLADLQRAAAQPGSAEALGVYAAFATVRRRAIQLRPAPGTASDRPPPAAPPPRVAEPAPAPPTQRSEPPAAPRPQAPEPVLAPPPVASVPEPPVPLPPAGPDAPPRPQATRPPAPLRPQPVVPAPPARVQAPASEPEGRPAPRMRRPARPVPVQDIGDDPAVEAEPTPSPMRRRPASAEALAEPPPSRPARRPGLHVPIPAASAGAADEPPIRLGKPPPYRAAKPGGRGRWIRRVVILAAMIVIAVEIGFLALTLQDRLAAIGGSDPAQEAPVLATPAEIEPLDEAGTPPADADGPSIPPPLLDRTPPPEQHFGTAPTDVAPAPRQPAESATSPRSGPSRTAAAVPEPPPLPVPAPREETPARPAPAADAGGGRLAAPIPAAPSIAFGYLVPPSTGGARVLIHHTAARVEDIRLAHRLAQQLERQGFKVADIRAVRGNVPTGGVRYYFPQDREIGRRLLANLGQVLPAAASEQERLMDFTHADIKPEAGTLEIWLPTSES